jgi:alpha-amylase/alpha-mannosidase (GH57 family)
MAQEKKEYKYQDLLDLQVFQNLVWFHPLVVEKDQNLRSLLRKGHNFTMEEKDWMLSKQIEVLKDVTNLWNNLEQQNQVEITASPFYHPILPLLVRDKKLYKDAEVQVKNVITLFETIFGKKITGMWPSEGGVSEEILPILKSAGIHWIATDEEILEKSIEKNFNRSLLYKPYIHKQTGIGVIFRDKELSNLIGFHYKSYDPKNAVDDFIARIKKIGETSKEPFILGILQWRGNLFY